MSVASFHRLTAAQPNLSHDPHRHHAHCSVIRRRRGGRSGISDRHMTGRVPFTKPRLLPITPSERISLRTSNPGTTRSSFCSNVLSSCTYSLRSFVRWTREWLKSERRIFGKAIVGDTFHQGTLMLKSMRQAYAAGGATSGISGVRSDANKDRGRSARTARQRPPSRSPVQADNSPILQETRLLWQRRAFPSQYRGILRSALPRIAAFRETLFLLMFKLLLAQRIEAVRVSARSKQNNRDKRQDQNNHRRHAPSRRQGRAWSLRDLRRRTL